MPSGQANCTSKPLGDKSASGSSHASQDTAETQRAWLTGRSLTAAPAWVACLRASYNVRQSPQAREPLSEWILTRSWPPSWLTQDLIRVSWAG